MYIMCVRVVSALSRRVGALQISIIIIMFQRTLFIRTTQNQPILGVIPYVQLQNDT